MIRFNITPPDESLRTAVQAKIDHLNKPKGSLGRLEELALQVCLAERTLTPTLRHPCHLLFGGDHGIEREGVSVSPREVTWQQMVNFTRGGGGVNMFCRQYGFDLKIVDVGVDHDLAHAEGIIHRKVARGTRNFLHEAAMSREEMLQALEAGIGMVDDCRREGCQVVAIGEMGIANTSPSSVWMSLLAEVPLDDCIGAGAGLDTDGIRHKRDVLREAIRRYETGGGRRDDTWEVVRHFGGFEMVAAVGAMLRAAELHLIILVDGFIMTVCALAACRLYPEAQAYMVFGHCGDESGHRLLLDRMGARPLLSLGLRLGEGTGALCAFGILESSVRMMQEMNTFDTAHITKYF